MVNTKIKIYTCLLRAKDVQVVNIKINVVPVVVNPIVPPVHSSVVQKRRARHVRPVNIKTNLVPVVVNPIVPPVLSSIVQKRRAMLVRPVNIRVFPDYLLAKLAALASTTI